MPAYISPKTASVHVSNILAKLGMTSRSEIVGYAVRAGLAEARWDRSDSGGWSDGSRVDGGDTASMPKDATAGSRCRYAGLRADASCPRPV